MIPLARAQRHVDRLSANEPGRVFARFIQSPSAGTCSVRAYRCRYDYRDDVERVRCAATERLVAFRSVA